MALQSSGAISLADIRTELSLSGIISLNDEKVRALAGKTSGIISLADFYGKSSIVAPSLVSVLVVAGGGGGGYAYDSNADYGEANIGGGGGAGGVVINENTPIVAGTAYSIIVGAGGSLEGSYGTPLRGSNSSAFSMTALGGGGGAPNMLILTGDGWTTDASGGSGGGGAAFYEYDSYVYGVGKATQTSNGGGTGYGNGGANAFWSGANVYGGGGGGAGGAASGNNGGAGITWNGVTYAVGGKGGWLKNYTTNYANTSYGGGGAGGATISNGTYKEHWGRPGNAGIVVIRYPATSSAPKSYSGGSLVTANGYHTITFTSSGSITF